MTSDVGKYLVSDFAKSYDGTDEYVVRTVPKVDSISSNEFYKAGGAILTISGEGFDLTEDNNQVKVDDLDCTIIKSTSTSIKCLLP